MSNGSSAEEVVERCFTRRQLTQRIVVIAIAYFIANKLAILFPGAGTLIMAIWPAAGIGLASLLLNPRRMWPAILAAIFVAGATADVMGGRGLLAGIGYMTANVLESLTSALVLQTFVGGDVRFQRVNDVAALIFCGTAVNACTAVIGAGTAAAFGSSFSKSWSTWWVADCLGLLLITPLIVAWLAPIARWRVAYSRVAESAAFLVLWCVAVVWAYFHQESVGSLSLEPYMITVLLAWPAIRLSLREVTLGLLIMAAAAISSVTWTQANIKFGLGATGSELLALQLFVGFRSVMGLLLASSIAELKQAKNVATDAHAQLNVVVDNLPNATMYQLVRDAAGRPRLLHLSAGVQRATGIPVAEALRNPMALYGIVVEEDRQRLADAEAASERNLTPLEIVVRVRRRDGALRWMKLSSRPRRIEDGTTVWDGLQLDVTDEMEAKIALQQSEMRLREVLDNSLVISYKRNLQTDRYEYLSTALLSISGYQPETFKYFGMEESISHVHPEDRAYVAAAVADMLNAETGTRCELEYRFLRKDGQYRWFHDQFTVLRDSENHALAFIGSVGDITDRRQAEAEVFDLYNKAPCGYHSLDESGLIIRMNDTELGWLGYSRDEIVGKLRVQDILAPQSRETALENFEKFKSFGTLSDLRLRFLRKDGSTFTGLVSATAIIDTDGRFLASRSTVYDITARERAETALRETDARLATILRNCPSGIGVNRMSDGRFVLVNDAFARLFERAASEIVGRTPIELGLWVSESPRDEMYESLREKGRVEAMEAVFRRKSGETITMLVNGEVITLGGESCFVGVVTDVTELLRSRAALASESALRRIMFENSKDGIIIVRLDGCVHDANAAFAEHLGYTRDELIGMHVEAWDARWTHDELLDAIKSFTEKGQTFETVHRLRDGSLREMEVSANAIAINGETLVLASHRDITERKRLTEEKHAVELKLHEIQKIESLSVLAGGIAHDFNNILFVILGNAAMVLETLQPDSPARDHIVEIEIAGKRAAELCKQMLAYSGRSRFLLERVRIEDIVSRGAAALRAALGSGAELEIEVTSNALRVECDVAQIQQMLLNLLLNAKEAIGERKGLVRITTTCVDASAANTPQLIFPENIVRGKFACIEVLDNGVGMSSETLKRVFEPFFSTKFTGRGLGMPAVLGIVRGHHGAISVESEPERGTRVRVYLPVLRDETESASSRTEVVAPTRGKASALIVDDDPQVLSVAKIMMERFGWDVITANGGQTGIETFRRNQEQIGIVLLDLSMPDIDGAEVCGAILDIDPQACVVVCSGYAELHVSDRFVDRRPALFLQKPYTVQSIREALVTLGFVAGE